jgi:hypothetical protein
MIDASRFQPPFSPRMKEVHHLNARANSQADASIAPQNKKTQDFYKIRFLNSSAPVQRRACKDASNAPARWQSIASGLLLSHPLVVG